MKPPRGPVSHVEGGTNRKNTLSFCSCSTINNKGKSLYSDAYAAYSVLLCLTKNVLESLVAKCCFLKPLIAFYIYSFSQNLPRLDVLQIRSVPDVCVSSYWPSQQQLKWCWRRLCYCFCILLRNCGVVGIELLALM